MWRDHQEEVRLVATPSMAPGIQRGRRGRGRPRGRGRGRGGTQEFLDRPDVRGAGGLPPIRFHRAEDNLYFT